MFDGKLVTCVKSLLQNLAPEIEGQVKSALRGLITRWVVSGYLPQTWAFQTEHETVTFNVDTNGNVSIFSGSARNTDVSVEVDHAVISAALRYRDRQKVPQGRLNVVAHTEKGRRAFDYLRGSLGL